MAAAAPKVTACIRLMLMPSVLAVAGSADAARSAVPRRVRVRTSWTAPMTTTASPNATTLTIWTVIPAMVTPLLAHGADSDRGLVPKPKVNSPCPTSSRPKVATSGASSECPSSRSRRNRWVRAATTNTTGPTTRKVSSGSTGTARVITMARYAPASTRMPCARLTTRMMPKTRDRPRATRA